jgi:hypothetical protein
MSPDKRASPCVPARLQFADHKPVGRIGGIVLLIAGILNRNGLVTGNGNRWTRERVTSLRSHHRIPVHKPAEDGIEPWLQLNKAAQFLHIAPKTLRLAAEAGEIRTTPDRRRVPACLRHERQFCPRLPPHVRVPWHDLDLPVKGKDGNTVWRRPNYATIHRMIENPVYGGAYAYGKTAVSASHGAAGVKARRKARGDWLALMPNAHEGYVSWERAETIRKMVSSNGSSLAISTSWRTAAITSTEVLLR